MIKDDCKQWCTGRFDFPSGGPDAEMKLPLLMKDLTKSHPLACFPKVCLLWEAFLGLPLGYGPGVGRTWGGCCILIHRFSPLSLTCALSDCWFACPKSNLPTCSLHDRSVSLSEKQSAFLYVRYPLNSSMNSHFKLHSSWSDEDTFETIFLYPSTQSQNTDQINPKNAASSDAPSSNELL